MARQKEWLTKSDLQEFAGSTTTRKALVTKLWTVLAGDAQAVMTRDRRPPLKMRTVTRPHKNWVPTDLSTAEYDGGMEVERVTLLHAYDQRWIYRGMAPNYGPAVHQLFVDWMEYLKQS